jgi:uncharacterized membrane protein
MADQKRSVTSWLKIALPISILLNLFLVAWIGGGAVYSRINANFGLMPGSVTAALARVEAELTPQDAAAFEAVMRENAGRYANALERLKEARQNLLRAITADPFDPDATDRAAAIWRAAWNGFFDDMGPTITQALSKISPEGRRRLAAAPNPRTAEPSRP